MRIKSRRIGAVALAIVAVTMLGIYGGSASGSPAHTASANAAGNYGVLSCFTGRLASLGQAMLQGSQVAQKAINAAGGVLGQKVKLSEQDTQCDLADAVPATQKLLSSGVSGVIGPETQEIAAVEPILKNSKIVDEFQGGDTGRDHQTDPFLFRDTVRAMTQADTLTLKVLTHPS